LSCDRPTRVSKRNFAKRNKTAYTSLPGYNVNVSDEKQPEFISLSELYIVIFLNILKIVENTKRK